MDHFDNDDKYIIPHNYTDNGKILGIVEKQSLYLAASWFIPMTFLNFRILPFSVDIKIFFQILLITPPTIIALVGIGGDTLFDFLKYIIWFYRNAKVYTKEIEGGFDNGEK